MAPKKDASQKSMVQALNAEYSGNLTRLSVKDVVVVAVFVVIVAFCRGGVVVLDRGRRLACGFLF